MTYLSFIRNVILIVGVLSAPTLALASGFGGGGGGGSGDITDVYDCATGDCSSITLSDTDLLDMSSVSVTTATEGLILPQHATDCSTLGTAEGQVCWEADADDLYIGDGATVAGPFIKAEADTLDTVFDRGKTVDGANSLANAVRIGDGTTPMCHYTDATLGPQIRPCTDANVRQLIPTNFTGGFYDEEGASDIFTIDPDAASVNAMYTFASGYRPLKSIYFPAGALSTDGTDCSDPAELTINSGPKQWGIVCPMGSTDTDGFIYGSVVMPDSYDGGTITFEINVVMDTDSGAGTMHGVIAAQSVADTDTIASTYGTGIDLDVDEIAGDVQWDLIQVTSAAVTASNTPAAGDLIVFRYKVCDSTGTPSTGCTNSTATTFTDFTILGIKMEYSVSSLSD